MNRRVTVVGMLILAGILLAGCSSDDGGSTDPQTGSVVIDATPDAINAPWTLAGPGGASTNGTGDTTLSGREPGEYTITWNTATGWTPPAQQTRTLAAGGTITFAGTYTEVTSAGTIVIDAEPNSIDAPWSLAGPDGYSNSGTGDETLSGVAIGQYTLTWAVVDEWLAPDPAAPSQTLEAGGTITFYGAYVEENPTTGSVIVDPEPNSINAPWFLTNNDDFEYSGSGDAALHGMTPGGYTVEWLDVYGWNTPRQQVLQLAAGDTATFECEYTETDQPPVACFTVNRTLGYVVDEFVVNATCSYDQGGTAGDLQFRWDWEDDGVWDHPGGDTYTTDRTASHYFDLVGEYAIRMEVMDPGGNLETTTQDIEIEPQTTGRIYIDPEPDLPNGPWTIAGPLGFELDGSGDHTLYDMPAGDYTIEWDLVEGWAQPVPLQQTISLVAGEQITFTTTYVYLGGQVELTLVSVPAGVFQMGSAEDALFRDADEVQHQVSLTHPYEIMTTEVTNQLYIEYAQWAVDNGYATATPTALYDNLDGSSIELYDLDDEDREVDWNGEIFTCVNPDHPVQEITWYGAAAFCDWLSLYDGLPRAYDHSTSSVWDCNAGDPYTAVGYRLPTEAEWEYACRATSTTAFANGEITSAQVDPVLDVIGWYAMNADGRNHKAAEKIPNAWGLYDMHGNLFEWCTDSYAEYPSTPVVNPVNQQTDWAVLRGGSWEHSPPECRSAVRYPQYRYYASNTITFRVVRARE